MEVLSVKNAKELDQYTIDEIGIPSIILMENAAHEMACNMINKGNKFVFFCGTGNNGGDGLAIARKLIIKEKEVKIYVVGDLKKSSFEFKVNYEILVKMMAEIEIINSEQDIIKVQSKVKYEDILVDAILGSGINRRVEGVILKLIEFINENANYVISIDNPSGLDGDTGEVLNASIKANETFVVEVLKKGYFNSGVKNYLGGITIVKIGIPNNVKEKFSEGIKILDNAQYRKMIPERNLYGHKGNYGRVLILAGRCGFTGAAYLVTEAAVRTGAGLVTLLIEKDIQPILAGKLVESMTVCYDDKDRVDELIKQADVIVCGPGLGNGSSNKDMLRNCIFNSKCPILVDADAISIIGEDVKLLDSICGRGIFTPHPGEMSRLIRKSIQYVEANRIDICRSYSKKYGIITVLKGYNTIISDGDLVVINNTGSSKMASGGMGDCLSGIIGALIAQKISLFDSAKLGCYMHGMIGDVLGKERYVVNARDIIEEIPKTMEYMLIK
ncbi:NAD(P)H-hydrate dehydratase [Clostridium cibarium]|uniref:Bifunctional NAD(P)H-hydrate repair enzyme n=1 Tax=Clostridium cibarium TaxID=2762247 RepID=A0ABR8PSK2_9CLOT|nr:NAD(P)H-hydrate dehydratase [Clostridium cibarium]